MAKVDCTRRYRAKYPEKAKAHSAVAAAVRRNRLARQPCEQCGSSPAEAHHQDYGQPLVVRWLCNGCHRIAHGRASPLTPEERRLRRNEYERQRLAKKNAGRRLKEKTTRPPGKIAEAVRLRGGGHSYRQVAAALGVTVGTAYKWINNPSYG